jgi:predicted Na+-dependent transporter
LANLAVGVLAITSMLSMGLSLTTGKIIAPLRNRRLVILALSANFILVPIFAHVIIVVLPVSETV